MESAESAEPERPAGIPESGFWNPSVGKWEVSPEGANGAREGERLLYRQDGSLFSRTRLVAGVEDGPFAVYHPDGGVAREGKYAAGQLDGLVTAYASSDPTGEPLRSCCVPPKAARLCLRYRAGDFLLETFFDREGRAILSDGRPCPPRPALLPELAQFDEGREGWAIRSGQLDRFWTVEGVLVEEVDNAADGGRVVRVFDGAGQISEECGFAADGKRRGTFTRRLPPGEPGPYTDQRVREERGSFECGQAVGIWTFLDREGAVLRTVDRGLPVGAELGDVSPAFADVLPDGEGGWALANQLLAERRVREAVCAAARVAARQGDRAALDRFLAGHLVALTPEIEAERGDAIARAGDADVTTILDGLMLGTDAAAVFRALAGVLPGTTQAAADFVEAALLLAPDRRMTHLTRALIRVQRGDEAGARTDLAAVEAESAGAGDSLLTYVRVVFRPFEFSPAHATFAPDPELGNLPAGVQSLEAVHHLAGVYATRLSRVRAAVRAILDPADGAASDPVWLPPDVSALLPGGPVALRRETITCDVEEGEGGEPETGRTPETPETIEINEEIALDGLGVPGLLTLAHADFGALSWLCWSTGLDRVALPDAIVPPTDLAAAMKMVVQRYWRAHDRLKTGGLLAMSNGVPGFEWQGVDIDLLPPHLVDTAAAEYLAARSMFLWLASPETLSPFQDDIRDA